MMAESVIVVDPDIINGMPCFRGTRVPFKNLIDYLEGGHSLGEFLRQFPAVTREMAVQSFEEAKDFSGGEALPREDEEMLSSRDGFANLRRKMRNSRRTMPVREVSRRRT